ncbi:MAG: TonB-dependent receptor domain-containing protein, partial [Pyrinomonadaceae bacterium]
TSGSFGLGYYGESGWISGTYNSDLRRYGIPFATLFEHHHEEIEEAEEDEQIDLRMRRQNFRIKGGFRNFNNLFLNNIQYNLDYTNYRHKEIEVIEGIDNPGTIFDNKIFSYRMLFDQNRYKSLTGRFGFEGFNRNYRITGEEQLIQGKVRHDSFSVFALQELDFERVKFQFGGRVERNLYRPENPDLSSRDFTGFSGVVGVNFALWEGGSFVTNYTHSFRSPALEELYNNGPHIGNVAFEIGNQNLRSEVSDGIDFSLRHNSRKFTFTGDFFYYNIRRFVFLAPQDEDGDGQVDIEDGLPVAKYEQADAKYYGGEIYTNANFNEYLSGFFSFDAVRAKLTDRNINVPRIPPARFRLGLDIRYKTLSLRPEMLFATSQNKIYPLETRTAGYGILNLGASYVIASSKYAHVF